MKIGVQRKMARSGFMECPVCSTKTMLVEHHIHGRNCPEKNKKWNRCWICPNCHDRVHAGLIIIERWSQTTEGKRLVWRNKEEEPVVCEGACPYVYKNN